MITRMLTLSDRGACRELWLSRFDDAPAFVDWFFHNRFSPANSVGTFDAGALVSMSLGYPMPLTSLHGDVPAWMLSGISTLPSYERQGLMHRTVRFQMRAAAQLGVPVVFNHPVRLHQYDSLGFRPITDTLYYDRSQPVSPDLTFVRCEPSISDMKHLYDVFSSACLGCICRSNTLFLLKMQDYLADNAQILGICQGARLLGYSVVFSSNERVHAEETVALDAYPPLLAALHTLADGRRVTAKLPPFLDVEGDRRAQNVAAFTMESESRDVQDFFGYPSRDGLCFAFDEY